MMVINFINLRHDSVGDPIITAGMVGPTSLPSPAMFTLQAIYNVITFLQKHLAISQPASRSRLRAAVHTAQPLMDATLSLTCLAVAPQHCLLIYLCLLKEVTSP